MKNRKKVKKEGRKERQFKYNVLIFVLHFGAVMNSNDAFHIKAILFGRGHLFILSNIFEYDSNHRVGSLILICIPHENLDP